MQSLASLTIDAGVLAVPEAVGTDNSPRQYVEKISSCAKLLSMGWIDVHLSPLALECLWDNGLYPHWEQLQELLVSNRIDEYTVRDIQTVVNQLLSITPSFEEYFLVSDLLQNNVETSPDISRLYVHESLRDHLERSFTMIALLRRHCALSPGGHLLFIRKAVCGTIKVQADIQILVHERDEIPELADAPLVFVGDVLVCDDVEKFVQCLDESAMLVGANDDKEFEIAIKVKLYEHAIEQGISVDWDTFDVPTIGSKFRVSCQQVCGAEATTLSASILRTIVKIVYKLNPRETHALRTGPGGNAPQQKRGADRAMRRNINRSFRLHYWEGENGAIELASVNYHNNFDIPL